MPLDQAPCGVIVDHNAVLLLRKPSEYFSALRTSPGAEEILAVPLSVDGQVIGAVWAVAHDPACLFEQEDARLLGRLAAIASVACQAEDRSRRAGGRQADDTDLEGVRAQLRRLVEGVPLLLWRAAGDGRWRWASPQWTQLTGQEIEAGKGLGWLDAVHPDDRQRARRAWRLAHYAEAFEVEYRLHDLNADRYRWFKTRASPVREKDGEIVEWLGTSTDIDDLQTARDRQRVLLAELQHRVRNMLAVVRSIARRTAERSVSVDDFQMHFDGRLGAFARAQSFVDSDAECGVDLETLVLEELFAHRAREGERVTIAGPKIRLTPRLADAIGLAIHELTVNAVKYGGLAGDHGQVEVRWAVEGAPAAPVLALTWFDAPPDCPVEHPVHHGFGRELIERSLVYDFDAVTRFSVEPDGLRCEIHLPLSGRKAEDRKA